jgi:hypothetical protein
VFKRLFFAMLGLGAGVMLGIWAVRKVEETRAKMSPEHLGRVAVGQAGSMRERLAVALEQGRQAAAEKEAELRAVYRVHPSPEVGATIDGGAPLPPA